MVELDHPDTHDNTESFVDDRHRDTARAAAGIITVRLLTEDLADPAGQAAQLAAILASRR